jgi:Site-specific recombinase XerD
MCLMAFAEVHGTTPKHLTCIQMEEFFAGLTLAATTKRMYLAQVRAAFRYALARGVIKMDPTIDVELPKVPDPEIRVLSNNLLRELRDNCHNKRQMLMFHLLAYTGCRKNEVREMNWSNISLEDQTIFVVGKGGKSRLVPIHPALGEILASIPHKPNQAVIPNPYGCPFNYSYWDKLREQWAGNKATFHDFRRTVASSLDANGVEEGVIMKIMGWAPKTVFDRHYRSIAPERLQQAILKLYADDPL